jgi:Trk K+ transport system NAD-binding subunit
MSSPQDFLQAIRQGDLQFLSVLLNQALQPQGVEVAVVGDYLKDIHIRLKASHSTHLDPDIMETWVQEQFQGIVNESFPAIYLHYSDSGTSWLRQVTLRPPQRSLLVKHPRKPILKDRFLVCGLGQLGQHCVAALAEFNVQIVAINLDHPPFWEIETVGDILTNQNLIQGDCRSERILLQAGITSCRSILLVTRDEGVNLAAAFTARKLNPNIRLVVRSSKDNLNRLLGPKLGNFIAYDPTQLPAAAFTLAALQNETIGTFSIDGCQLQVVQRQVKPDEPFDRFAAYLCHKRSYRLLYHRRSTATTPYPAEPFHAWAPNTCIEAGDTIVYIEVMDPRPFRSQVTQVSWQNRVEKFCNRLEKLALFNLSDWLREFWHWCQGSKIRQNIVIASIIAPSMGILTSFILKTRLGLTWQEATSAAVVLLLGGYGDVFGGLELSQPIPVWVQFFCFFTTAVSILFVLGVIGLIADSVLSTRFGFLNQRPPIPERDHVVIFGLGRVGQKVLAALQQRQHPVVAVTQDPDHESLFPQVPLVIGNYFDGLNQVNLEHARSVVLVTEDQLLNLELGLMAYNSVQGLAWDRGEKAFRDCPLGLVIRTYDQQFRDNLARLLPESHSLCVYALTAEVFAGAAFGENILGLFRLHEKTILATEYHIEAEDTLNNKLISQVAYGYRVMPIFYQRASDRQKRKLDPKQFLMPSDDIRLGVGDRLVVLATISGLKRIERGELLPLATWQLTILPPLNKGVLFEAAQVINNVTGCGLQAAKSFLAYLPGKMQVQLYHHQAYRLWQNLNSMKQLPTRLERIELNPK